MLGVVNLTSGGPPHLKPEFHQSLLDQFVR